MSKSCVPEPSVSEPPVSEPSVPDPSVSGPSSGVLETPCESSSVYPAFAPSVSLVREPAAAYEVEAEPAVGWPWEDALESVPYSIRVPEPAGPARCGRCRVRFSATGPTGFAEDQPICDMCLLEGSSALGMVMALVAVVRAFGAVRPSGHEDYREALAELGGFARIYERFAAKSGPARIFRIPSFEVDG